MRSVQRTMMGAAGRKTTGFTIATQHVGYGTASASYAAAVPATIHQNDLILFQFATNTTVADVITAPASVTETPLIASSLVGSVGYAWYWHYVTAAEAATPPANWTFTLATARTGNVMTTRITGHNMVTTFDTAVSQAANSGTTLPVPSITTTVPGCLLVGGGNLQSATTQTVTVPTGWTQDDTTCGLSFGRGQVAGHMQLGAAGATGIQSFTLSSALAGEGFMIAIRPA